MKATCLWELNRINLKGRGEDYVHQDREVDLDITIEDARELLATLQSALHTFEAFEGDLEKLNT